MDPGDDRAERGITSGARTTRLLVHPADLEEGRPHKIFSN